MQRVYGNCRDGRRQTQTKRSLPPQLNDPTEQPISGTLSSCTLRSCVLACHSFRKTFRELEEKRRGGMHARVSPDHRQVLGLKLHVLSLSSMHFPTPSRSPFCVSCRYTSLACHRCDTRHPRSQLDSTNFVRLVRASAIISLERRDSSSWRLPKSLHRCPSAEVTAHFFVFQTASSQGRRGHMHHVNWVQISTVNPAEC